MKTIKWHISLYTHGIEGEFEVPDDMCEEEASQMIDWNWELTEGREDKE